MTERWRTELERLDRFQPADDLLVRASERPRPPLPPPSRRRQFSAIVVAVGLTAGLVIGGLALVRDRSMSNGTATGPTGVAPGAGDNGDLLYASNLGNAWHVYALDPETGEERELTQGSRDYGSDWSPDGTRIVYESETDGGNEILVAGADGSDAVSVGQGHSPAWSPDETRIAYSSDDGRLWVVGVDGSDAHPITDPGTGSGDDEGSPFDWNASWSPDGRSIAYTRVVSGKYLPVPNGNSQTHVTLEELRVWSEDGTDVALTDAYAGLGGVDWSPDGSTLVFTGGPTLFHEESTHGLVWPRVMTIPASGGEATPITEERERWIAGATWSPDGEWIAFQDDYETIAIVRPDGSDRREVALGHEVIGLSWGVRSSGDPSGPS